MTILGKIFRFIVLIRFQLFIAVVLVAFPIISLFYLPAKRLLGNLFVLDWPGLIWAIWLTLLVAWAFMVTVQIAYRNIHRRIESKPFSEQWPKMLDPQAYSLYWYGLLALPMVAVLVWFAESEHWWLTALGTVLGLACGMLTLRFATWLFNNAVGPEEAQMLAPSTEMKAPAKRRAIVSWLSWLLLFTEHVYKLGIFRSGYIDQTTGKIRHGHQMTIVFLIVAAAIYFGLLVLGNPAWQINIGFPALGYVLLLLLTAAWLLPGLAFFVDRWRIPLLMLLVLLFVMMHWGTDHYFTVLDISESEQATPPAVLKYQQTVDGWTTQQKEEKERVLVVVATSGGGITASTWTAKVLAELEEASEGRFNESLHAISAVSGGSIGTLHYLSGFSRNSYRRGQKKELVIEGARMPSLDAITWGVVYPDLARTVCAPVMWFFRDIDRGWAMEQSWKHQLPEDFRHKTLRDLREATRAGEIPVAFFNSVVVETGYRYVFTPIDMRLEGLCTDRCESFLDLYEDQDISLVTAARVSATFPWVSPIARPSKNARCVAMPNAVKDCGELQMEDGSRFHLADGGYFDNFGVVTLVEWLDEVLQEYAALGGVKVLIVEIDGSTGDPLSREALLKDRGTLYATLGPVVTLLNAKQATQRYRNESSLDDKIEKWKALYPGIQIAPVKFQNSCPDAPLSWQLSEDERDCIDQSWGLAAEPLETTLEFLGVSAIESTAEVEIAATAE